MSRRSLAELNSASCDEFVRCIGPVFEGSAWIANATWIKRPFRHLDHLHSVLCETVRAAALEKQLALICAHPDLVGKGAGILSQESTREQAGAGLANLTPDEIATFQSFNKAYREKFGFPFVICARLNKKEAILQGFRRRLEHSREDEVGSALEEIYKIAYLRLQDIFR
jgi:OHCU decarboxylase